MGMTPTNATTTILRAVDALPEVVAADAEVRRLADALRVYLAVPPTQRRLRKDTDMFRHLMGARLKASSRAHYLRRRAVRLLAPTAQA